MIPEYTDAELMLFAEAYNEFTGDSVGPSFIRNLSFQEGILQDILLIPYEDLPLYLSSKKYSSCVSIRSSSGGPLWYEACISIRFKIGR